MIEIPDVVLDLIGSGALVVVPTAQRLVALQLAFAQRQMREGRGSWRSPRICTWRSWLERAARQSTTPAVELLAEADEWLLWRDAALATWQADEQPSDELIEALRHSATLVFESAIPERALSATPEADWLARAIARCDAACAARAATPSYRLAAIAQTAQFEERAFLIGFSNYTPVQRRLLDSGALQDIGLAVAQSRNDQRCSVRGIVAGEPAEEIALAAQWARECLAADPAARLLVLVADLRQREQEVLRRFEQTLQPARFLQTNAPGISLVGLEGGQELHEFALVKRRLAIIKPPRTTLGASDFLRWLRLLTADLGSAIAAARLDARLRAVLEPETSMAAASAAISRLARGASDYESVGRQIIARLELLGRVDWTSKVSMAQWGAEFRRLWRACGAAGLNAQSARSAEQQTAERFEALLDELCTAVPAARAIEGTTAAALLAAAARRTRFEPASGDTSVTISGVLSDPIVSYDGIWVAGLDAGAWPPPAKLDAFIPAAAQRAAGLLQANAGLLAQDAERRQQRWIESTGALVLSWSRSDAGLERRASALVERALEAKAFESGRGQRTLAESLHTPGKLERFDDALGVPWTADRQIPGGTRAIELQARCAFRAYAELRLRAAPQETRASGIDPRHRGLFMHKALEHLWGELGSGAGLRAAMGAIDAFIERAIASAERQLDAELAWQDATHDAHRHRLRERRRLAALLCVLCELDSRRPEFTDVECEIEASLELAGARLRVRIDRVDRLTDGTLAVFDYKSGRPRTLALTAERLTDPQLPLYALACEQTVSAVALVHLTAGAATLKGLAARSDLIGRVDIAPDWDQQLRRWRDQLESLTFAFLSGDALRDPAPDVCRNCHLQVFCRISTAAGEAEALIDE